MKIFLTGSTGFIGSHLLQKLQNLGHEVVTDWRYWGDRYDCIIHLAAVTHIRTEFDPNLYESNIVLAKKVFSTPNRIIYASSCSAKYLTNPYAYSKRYSEYLGEKHGNALGLRFHNIYGNGNNKGIVWHLMNQPDGATIEVKGANLVRDYVHVDDVVDSIISLMKPDGFAVNMAAIREIQKNKVPPISAENAVKLFFEQGIQFTEPDTIPIKALRGILDIGTGVGTRTIDLVHTFEKVSGKTFKIKTNEEWGGGNEPTVMVSNNPVPAMSLETGLLKTITDETAKAK